MKTMVIGSGGREHALSWKLAQETEVVCAPGNPGIAQDVETLPIAAADTAAIVKTAKDRAIDLVVVGPEDPLITGLADALREAGIATYGPGASGARLEGSKAFSKRMMEVAGVPTAEFEVFQDERHALEYARKKYGDGGQLAVKASGAALGKGVIVAEDLETAEDAIHRMMSTDEFGTAGRTLVLEERLVGPEISLLTVVGDHNIRSLPLAQDYKRAYDNDQGPNTGGVGSYSPCNAASVEELENLLVNPLLNRLKEEGIPFRGTLFTGAMLTATGLKCIEYNVRFGDPETQAVMVRLGGGFANMLYQAATGARIDSVEVREDLASVCVVVMSDGYPGTYAIGKPIEVGALPAGVKLFCSGVSGESKQMVTAGGRVVGVTAIASTIATARALAYEGARAVKFDGARFRSDVAHLL